MISTSFFLVFAIAAAFTLIARNKAFALAGGELASLHSRPNHHGMHAFLLAALVGLAALIVL